jgi:DNA-binding NarL/FixJ family response regulator
MLRGFGNKNKQVSVVLVEDQELVRFGIKMSLEKLGNISILAEATNGTEAVELVLKHHPHFVLMDIGMPEMDGIEASRKIKEKLPKTKIVILSSRDEIRAVSEAFKAGVEGFCLKGIESDILQRVFESIDNGKIYIEPAIAKLILQETWNPRVSKTSAPALTEEEMNVLKLIADEVPYDEVGTQLKLKQETFKTILLSISEKISHA